LVPWWLSEAWTDLYRGEVLAIIGDNGAGKSNLVKCLTGAEIADVGEIRVAGRLVKFRKPQNARDAGVETVYQTLSLSPALDIASNLFLGRERVREDFLGRWLRVLDKQGMRRDAEAKVATLGIRTIQDINQVVETLSGGQRQAVAVARAVAFGDKVIVLDEPTAALGVRETRQVLDIVQQLRTRGLGIILICRNMPQVFEVADRIHIQRLRRCAGTITPQTHTMPQAVAIMTGAMSIGDSFPGASASSAKVSNSSERQPTMSAPCRRKIILDTDPAVGIPGSDADDPLALMLALKDPRLDLLGVATVFGNCSPALGARCAPAVLRAAGREDVPIAIGMATCMNGELPQPLRDAYAGDRGRPGRIELPELIDPRTRLNAVDVLIETVLANPGEVTIPFQIFAPTRGPCVAGMRARRGRPLPRSSSTSPGAAGNGTVSKIEPVVLPKIVLMRSFNSARACAVSTLDSSRRITCGQRVRERGKSLYRFGRPEIR
jgi:fructose transport system ATP-binding protein